MPPGSSTVVGAQKAWLSCWVTPLGQVALLTASGAQFHSLLKHLLSTEWASSMVLGVALKVLRVLQMPSKVNRQGSISGSEVP